MPKPYAQKQKEAAERQAAYDVLTPKQKLAGASKKVRDKLNKFKTTEEVKEVKVAPSATEVLEAAQVGITPKKKYQKPKRS